LPGRLFGDGRAPAEEVLQAVSASLLRVIGELSFELSPVPATPGAADRPGAAGPLARLLASPPADRPVRVARDEEVGSWRVCVLVCEASVSAAADKASRALELAMLALFIAERVSGWLEGRLAAGLGRRAEAIDALRQVRREFADHELAADAALVTLNLAVLLLEEGRTGEVRELAGETVPIFGGMGLDGEAIAALGVFWRAAEQEMATAELGRRLLAFLERARYDPEFRFDPRAI